MNNDHANEGSDSANPLPAEAQQHRGAKLAATDSKNESRDLLPVGEPLITRAAELTLATNDFAKSRGELENILAQHRGYAARLRMTGRHGGSVLSAVLKIPSSELTTAIVDLKALGEVEQEEQAADEVTRQHADLLARLRSTKHLAKIARFAQKADLSGWKCARTTAPNCDRER